jgi:leader peptidase (prepilin peptidase) / N-methyltransferase
MTGIDDAVGLGPQHVRRNAAAAFIAATAVVASLAASPHLTGALGAALALLMLAIAIIDARSFIIPDELTAAALALALVNAALLDPLLDFAGIVEEVTWSMVRGIALAACFLAVRAAYRRLRGREGIGLGDVKLAGVAGAWLGWTMMPIAVEVAALAALGMYALRQAIGGRPIRATGRLPFGLFLAPAIWLCWLLETTLVGR